MISVANQFEPLNRRLVESERRRAPTRPLLHTSRISPLCSPDRLGLHRDRHPVPRTSTSTHHLNCRTMNPSALQPNLLDPTGPIRHGRKHAVPASRGLGQTQTRLRHDSGSLTGVIEGAIMSNDGGDDRGACEGMAEALADHERAGPASLSENVLAGLLNSLVAAAQWEQLVRLLTDWRYLAARVAGGTTFPLVEDVRNAAAVLPGDWPQRRMVWLIGQALQRSAALFVRHCEALFQCLWNLCWRVCRHPSRRPARTGVWPWSIKRRLAQAQAELDRADEYRYNIIYDDLDREFGALRSIVVEERHRSSTLKPST